MRQERYAVQASVSATGTPQAALVGVIVTDDFEVFFDAHDSSRKTVNLRQNATAALVLGPVESDIERTVQLEGTADEPKGAELERFLELYFARFPQGRERRHWPRMTYWRVTPTWLRYSDYSVEPQDIREYTSFDLS
jgi:pyridoxine/pyridoxamine 5'-phosphate oxidase